MVRAGENFVDKQTSGSLVDRSFLLILLGHLASLPLIFRSVWRSFKYRWSNREMVMTLMRHCLEWILLYISGAVDRWKRLWRFLYSFAVFLTTRRRGAQLLKDYGTCRWYTPHNDERLRANWQTIPSRFRGCPRPWLNLTTWPFAIHLIPLPRLTESMPINLNLSQSR